jgi:segregation and condensation protein A
MTDPDDGVPSLDLTTKRDGDTPDMGSVGESGRGDDGNSKTAADREKEPTTEENDAAAGEDDAAAGGDDAAAGGDDAATGGDDAAADEEVEPVEILVQLAEEGAIEPWDIDIVRVTDAFLAKLDEVDLRTTGRALFYASVLLRMKSDELLVDDADEEPEPEPWEVAMEGGVEDPADPGYDPIDALESEMDRRLERKRARGTPETLDELVRDLRDAERDSWWKSSREYDTTASPSGYDRGTQTLDYHAGDEFRREGEPTAGEATDRTHDEAIETVIDDVETAVRPHFDAGRAEVLFAEVADAGGRPFMTFLGLLFMAHRGSVVLRQDELFGDLWIRDPAAATGESEAVAD